jgi:4-amino-4-deoxy-L-arabinose transferase-like glycosyltransferase
VSESEIPHEAVCRTELWLVAAIICVGGVLRFHSIGSEGLSHYDEGVYVLWAMGLEFPAKELFAPPLFPLVLRAVFALVGSGDFAAQAANALIGTATLPLVWWIGRRWFGRQAGFCSLILAACSGLHVAFSRTALTDVSFTFWFALAVWASSELTRRSGSAAGAQTTWPWAISLGLAAGAAVNTKYNGLLALPIAAAPFVVNLACGRVNQRLAVGLAAAAGVAVLMYAPWFLHVSRVVEGGYPGLLRHHRGYSTGVLNWPQNLGSLMLSQGYLNNLTLRCLAAGMLAACGIAWAIRERLGLRSTPLAAGAGLAAGLALSCPAVWPIGLVFAAIEMRNRRAAGVLLFAWLGVFLVLTPMYRPYARLLLPLEAASWIASGAIMAAVVRVDPTAGGVRLSVGWAVTLSVGLVLWSCVPSREPATPTRDAAMDLARAAAAVAQAIPDHSDTASFVRPPVLFYVAHKRVRPVADLEWLARPGQSNEPHYLLVDQALLQDNPHAASRAAEARRILREVTRSSYRPSAVVLLDDTGTGQTARNYLLTLYRIERVAVSRETQ